MNLPHLLRPAPLRKRLWQLGVLLALVTITFVSVNACLPKEKAVTRQMLGHDFLAFYTAGSLVREGRTSELYDMKAVATREQEVAAAAGLDISIDYAKQKFGPWWNPPFYALLFVPLSMLPFNQAVAVWTLLNMVALGAALVMLVRILAPGWLDHDSLGRPVDWQTTGLVPLLVLLSMPFVQAMSHGQNTLMSLFLLTAVVKFWRSKRAILAGACCALLAYKPQLAAVVACMLVASLGLRALVGLTLVGSAMILANQLLLPETLVQWLHRLPENVRYMQIEHTYMWERHVTLKAFWRLLLRGREAGEMGWLATSLYAVSFVTLATLLIRCAWSQVRSRGARDDAWGTVTKKVWRDRLIAATICSAPLLMPFYFDYDLLLLTVPAVLLASEQLARPAEHAQPRADQWLLRLWVCLYAWLLINPGMSNLTRINGATLILGAIALLMIRRATRPFADAQSAIDDDVPIIATPVTIVRRRAA